MGITIGEAIERYKNNAEYERTHGNLQGCLEFRQLAEWLEQYQKFKADYETRLKADMVAMLTEISLKFDEQYYINRHELHDDYLNRGLEQGQSIIQQKIDALKGEQA